MLSAKDFMIEWFSEYGTYPSEEEYLSYIAQFEVGHNESIMGRSDTGDAGQSGETHSL